LTAITLGPATRNRERASCCWCNDCVARAAALVAALAAVLVLAPPVHAAAPNYILVSGPGLKRPIILGNWSENAALLSALVNAPRAKGRDVLALARRPRFDLAEFWGWGSMPRPTRPSQANQHGWFYPRASLQATSHCPHGQRLQVSPPRPHRSSKNPRPSSRAVAPLAIGRWTEPVFGNVP
jgi:hypothetical protein